MWMAEWLFTDFFQRAVATARRGGDDAGSRFGPTATFDSNGADRVEKRGECEHEHKQHSEQKLRRNQFTDEIELQNNKDGQSPSRALAKRLVLPEITGVFPQLG